jgi:hypothetical protein
VIAHRMPIMLTTRSRRITAGGGCIDLTVNQINYDLTRRILTAPTGKSAWLACQP